MWPDGGPHRSQVDGIASLLSRIRQTHRSVLDLIQRQVHSSLDSTASKDWAAPSNRPEQWADSDSHMANRPLVTRLALQHIQLDAEKKSHFSRACKPGPAVNCPVLTCRVLAVSQFCPGGKNGGKCNATSTCNGALFTANPSAILEDSSPTIGRHCRQGGTSSVASVAHVMLPPGYVLRLLIQPRLDSGSG